MKMRKALHGRFELPSGNSPWRALHAGGIATICKVRQARFSPVKG